MVRNAPARPPWFPARDHPMLSECTTPLLIASSSGQPATSGSARCGPSSPTPSSSSSDAMRGGPDKVGRDVGDLCGIEPLGIAATNDVDALLALPARRAWSYNPKWPDVDELVRILEAGVGRDRHGRLHHRPHARRRPRLAHSITACERGSELSDLRLGHEPRVRQPARASSPPASATGSTRSGVLESVDSPGYDSPDTEMSVGLLTRPIDDPELPGDGREGHRGVRRCGVDDGRGARASSSTRSCASRSSRKPRRTSTSARG